MFAGTTHGALHVTDSGTLNIHGVRKEDGGFYICTALSVAGSSVTKAYLEVCTLRSRHSSSQEKDEAPLLVHLPKVGPKLRHVGAILDL